MSAGKSVRIKLMLRSTSGDQQDASHLFQAGSCGSAAPVAYSCVISLDIT